MTLFKQKRIAHLVEHLGSCFELGCLVLQDHRNYHVENHGRQGEERSHDSYGLGPCIHGNLKYLEHPEALGRIVDVPDVVESVPLLHVDGDVRLGQYLISSTGFEKASRRVVVTVPNPLDDGFDLGVLNDFQEFELDGDLERVSADVVLLEHHVGEEVLVVVALDILQRHFLDPHVDFPALVVETEEFVLEQNEELVQEAHAEEGVARVAEQVVFEGTVVNLDLKALQEVFGAVE